MTFRIQTATDKEGVTFSLSGRIDPLGAFELQRLMERTANGHPITIDLQDIQLVDRFGVSMLGTYERAGIKLRNCPDYVREWMSRERDNLKGQYQEEKKMNNILVTTFNNDTTAIDALHKLYELDRQDDIEVLNHVLLKRHTDGTFEYLKDERDPAGWGALSGMLLGSFVGLIGGPVGVIAGMFGGLTLGAVADAFQYSFDYEFMENFKEGIPPGTTTLIAEVSEPSSIFVNEAFAPFGAKIWRSNIYTEQDKYVQTQVDAMDAEIAETERQLKAAAGENKAALQAKVKELRARRDARVAEIKADIDDDVDSIKADIDRLKTKIQGKVDGVRKNRLEYKLARNQERIKKYETQAEKLNSELAQYKTATNV